MKHDPHTSKDEPQLHDGQAHPGKEYMDVSRIHAAIMREKDEPAEGMEPVPMLWFGAVIALAMWGGWYLGSFNLNFSADALEGSPVLASTQGDPKPVKEIDPMVQGKRIFNSCAACHQGSGAGIPGQFPPLAQSEWVLGDDATLVRILLQGLEGPMTVQGKPYNGVMPAWGSKLSDTQIASVLTYIRGSWGNATAAIAPQRVQEVRGLVGKRESAWSEKELLSARGEP